MAQASENYVYNNFGQMTQLSKVIGATTYPLNYTYNLAGELTSVTYPSGRVITQNLDNIGRLSSIVGNLNTVNTTYAGGFAFSPANQVIGFQYGNNVYASFGYSADRLQLNCLDYSTTNRSGSCAHDGTTKFGVSFSYGSAGSNNGLLGGITDSVDTGRSATYTYDSLYRLSTAITTGSTNYPKWGLSLVYDRYGNRTDENQSFGSPPMNHVLVSTSTNRITSAGYAYDANGNMTNDGTNTLVYDAENRTLSATNGGASGTYTYDGNNLRVKKVSGATTTVYLFSGSKVVAEYVNGALPAAPTREYIYSGGALLAKIESGATKYYHQDHLSNRLVTDSSGNTLAQIGHFPFGESWYNASSDKLVFTSYERDAESGNDYAMARYNVNRLGRFSSPDPVSGSPRNPQSLNRYAYTQNNPINAVDPTGRVTMLCKDMDGACLFNSVGGGGSTCTADGTDIPCWVARDLLGSGSAVQCPNNTCTAIGSDGRPRYFWASTNGSGNYYNYSGPGALYYSQDAAGVAAMNYSKDQGALLPVWDDKSSKLGSQEWGGETYYDQNGAWSFSEPIQGPFCAEGSEFCTIDVRQASVPDGAAADGMYHLHSAWWLPLGFSAYDYAAAAKGAFGYPVPSYLLTLDGYMAVFDMGLPAPHIWVFQKSH